MADFLPPVNIVLLLFAIVTLVFGIYAYAKSIRRKKPRWTMVTNTWIRGYSAKLTGLQVLYQGERVENLAVSRVLFWNAGDETIVGTDIAAADPLRIEADRGIRILNADLLAANNEASQFAIQAVVEQRSVLLRFDYLDRGHGGVVQVVHTGVGAGRIQLAGSVKGAGTAEYQKPDSISFLWSFAGTIFRRRLGSGKTGSKSEPSWILFSAGMAMLLAALLFEAGFLGVINLAFESNGAGSDLTPAAGNSGAALGGGFFLGPVFKAITRGG